MIKKKKKSVARLFKILAPPKIQFSEKKKFKKILLARSILLMKKIRRTSNQFGVVLAWSIKFLISQLVIKDAIHFDFKVNLHYSKLT